MWQKGSFPGLSSIWILQRMWWPPPTPPAQIPPSASHGRGHGDYRLDSSLLCLSAQVHSQAKTGSAWGNPKQNREKKRCQSHPAPCTSLGAACF
jgi:hypothetical protein